MILRKIKQKLSAFELIRKFKHIYIYNFKLKRKLNEQLDDKKINKYIIRGTKILIPLIETSHYQFYQLLIIAKGLEIRGADIKILVCGSCLDGCEIKSIRNVNDNDPCFKCRFNVKNILNKFNFNIVTIDNYVSHDIQQILREEAYKLNKSTNTKILRHGIDLERCINDSIIRYYYGNVPNDQTEVDKIRLAHISTALISIEVAKKIDIDFNPDIILSSMPSYSAWEPYYKYYKLNGNRFKQISISQFNFNSLQYNSFELYLSSSRFNNYKNSRQNKNLNQLEKKILEDFYYNRISGEAQIFKKDNYFLATSKEEHLKKLKLNKSKRNIFLFSNVYWDIGLSELSSLYNGVIEWVLDTIELLKEEENIHLYIKPHPAEVFDSSSSLKGVSTTIKEKYPILPRNITIIEPEWQILTYDLFEYIDLGVIFNGTIGIEMMMSNIPVISTGRTTHFGLGLAYEPINRIEYKTLLLGEKPTIISSKDSIDLFAYFYFIRSLIPWTLTETTYSNNFMGYNLNSLYDIEPGNNLNFDHLCNCILDKDNTVPEMW